MKIPIIRTFHFPNNTLTMHPMNPVKILLLPSAIALTLASCASNGGNQYDTSSPYGPADGGNAYQTPEATTQTYDTPAAYEEAGASNSTAAMPDPGPNLPAGATPSRPAPARPATGAPVHASGGAATLHTVVKGDTLSGIASKYKVPVASIKAANNMTKDTVVLGTKIKIPAN